MTLTGLRARILGAALVTATLAVLLVVLSMGSVVSWLMPDPDPVLPDSIIQACLADPDAWRSFQVGPAQVRMLGADHAPELAVGESVQDRAEGSRQITARIAAEGPCAVYEMRIGAPPDLLSNLQLGAALGAAIAVLGVVGLTYMVALAPLLRRIHRIRQGALRVGRDDYEPAQENVHDALGEIATVLNDSHSRIHADREELIARHQALERHLAEIAHDLRTPLGSLLLALQDVHAAVDDDTSARRSTRRALEDAAYVMDLVENLHQAARMRHGLEVTEGASDLREIVSRLEVRFRALGQATEVEVGAGMPDQPVPVRCTPTLAERAIANLMQNAVAHASGHVGVVLDLADGGFRLRVLDDGPGVPDPADLAERTFTADPARRRSAGLGLAITNEIVRRAGWSIDYREGEAGGLEIEIRGALHEA